MRRGCEPAGVCIDRDGEVGRTVGCLVSRLSGNGIPRQLRLDVWHAYAMRYGGLLALYRST